MIIKPQTTVDDEIVQAIEEAQASGKRLENLAVSYARISGIKQETGNSKDDQRNNAHEYAETNNLIVVYTFTATESAFKENRLIFNLMLDKAKEYGVKNIIFKNTDRLGRNDVDWPMCKKLAKEQDFRIHLYELNKVFERDSTAEDEMFLDSTANFAKYWSNKISQGVKRAYRNKLKRQQPLNSPTGYKWNEEKKDWDFAPEYKHIILEMFELYDVKKYSMGKIATLLNAKGYQTRGKKYKTNTSSGNFYKSTVHAILTNPFYSGYFKVPDGRVVKGSYPAYISKERFDQRIKIMKSRFVGHRKGDTDYLFRKFVQCPCGMLWTGQRNKSGNIYYYHKCKNLPKRAKKEPLLPEKRMIKTFVDEVSTYLFSEEKTDLVRYIFKNSIQSKNTITARKRTEVNKRISALERQKQKALELHLSDSLSNKDFVAAKLNEIDEQIEALIESQKSINADLSKHEHKVLETIEYLRDFSNLFQEANDEEKVKLVKAVALGAHSDGNTMEIEWLEPFSFLFNKKVAGFIGNPGDSNSEKLSTGRGG